MTRTLPALALAAALLVLLATPAGAHAALTTASSPAGAVADLQMRVPEERDGDATTAVAIQVPAGFSGVACGTKAAFACAVTTDGDASVVTYTRDPAGSAVADDLYPLVAQAPAELGTYPLPTVQTYASGTVVRWIGDGGDEPAPELEVTADAHASQDASPSPAAEVTPISGGESQVLPPSPEPAEPTPAAASEAVASPAVPEPLVPTSPAPSSAASPSATAAVPSASPSGADVPVQDRGTPTGIVVGVLAGVVAVGAMAAVLVRRRPETDPADMPTTGDGGTGPVA